MSFIDQGDKLAYDELVRNIHGTGNGWKCHPYLGEVSDQTDFAVESPEGKIVFIIERRISMNHLIDEDTQRPPVHTLIVASGLEDLWSKVLWCST